MLPPQHQEDGQGTDANQQHQLPLHHVCSVRWDTASTICTAKDDSETQNYSRTLSLNAQTETHSQTGKLSHKFCLIVTSQFAFQTLEIAQLDMKLLIEMTH